MCVHATWTQKLHRATTSWLRTAEVRVVAALIRRARHRAHRRPARHPPFPRHRIHHPRYQSCAKIQELFLEEGVRLLQVVQAAAPASRTMFQLILQARRLWHRVSPTAARASVAQLSVTTAEGFVNAATEIRQRCPFHHYRQLHQRRRHQYARWGATHAAIIGTRSTLTRFHSRNTAAAAEDPLSSKTFASRVALTAHATRRLLRRRRCHHRPVQHLPSHQAYLPLHPHLCRPLLFAPTTRWWVLRLVDVRPRWQPTIVIAILTRLLPDLWWASSSRIAH